MNMFETMRQIVLALNSDEFKVAKSQTLGHIEVSYMLNVRDYTDIAVKVYNHLDDPWMGCPHHYELSSDKTKVLYVRHGTSWAVETGSYYVEDEHEKFECFASFNKAEILAFKNEKMKADCLALYEALGRGEDGRYYK